MAALVEKVEEWILRGCPTEDTVGFIVGTAPSQESKTEEDLRWEEDEDGDGGDEIWRASMFSRTKTGHGHDGTWRDPSALPSQNSLIY